MLFIYDASLIWLYVRLSIFLLAQFFILSRFKFYSLLANTYGKYRRTQKAHMLNPGCLISTNKWVISAIQTQQLNR